ncbi:MAG: 4Fe-4S dicluster domain-containing protein [Candidatus Latescibacterota bacterium]
MIRKMIQIDEEKCTGCGLCIPNCVEGALQIIDGKARLVSDVYCDGLGACLGECPEGSLSIVEREAEAFDEEVAKAHAKIRSKEEEKASFVCPGAMAREIERCPSGKEAASSETHPSKLTNWPVQLNLVSPKAPYFKDADLLVVADCVPFAMADFHTRLLRGKTLVVGCPKLDDAGAYVEKLTAILKQADLRSLAVVRMEVPCCFGLVRIVQAAIAASGKDIPFETITVSIQGEEI